MDLDDLRSQYNNSAAKNYDQRRENTEKWKREQKAVTEFMRDILEVNREPLVLDIPVGTGRFLDFYKNESVSAIGVDISEDMLARAREKITNGDAKISFEKGDIMDLSELGYEPDIVVCIRFMNWLNGNDVKRAVQSIGDTNPSYIIVGIRVRNSIKHQFADMSRAMYHKMIGASTPKTTIHNEKDISEIFRVNNFEIINKELVDNWVCGNKYIYKLKHRDGAN